MPTPEETFGRALVAAGGLSAQARWRGMMGKAFRYGGRRLQLRQGQGGDDMVVSSVRPLPPRQLPKPLPETQIETGDELDGPE